MKDGLLRNTCSKIPEYRLKVKINNLVEEIEKRK